MNDVHLAKEWQDKFKFIEKAKLTGAYMTLLALAKSKRDIQRLHALLPDDCRLLRDELIELVKFWTKMYGKTKPPQHSKRVDDAVASWMIVPQASSSLSLDDYYYHKLFHDKIELDAYWDFPPNAQRICFQKNNDKFECAFVGHEFDIRFTIWKNTKLYVTFELISFTEPTVHKLLNLSAVFYYSGPDIIFPLPAKKIFDHFEPELSDSNCSGYLRSYIAKSSFCRTVEKILKDAGIPVSNMRTVT